MTFWRKASPKHKYGAKRTDASSLTDGRSFQSALERSVYLWLKAREQAGELVIESCQDSVYLTDARILYKPDFRVRDAVTGEVYWVEAKGLELPAWRIKRRLWLHYGKGRLVIVKGSGARLRVHEELVPKKGGTDE
ncbi:MAG: hypothetical protein ACK52V_12610 [Betaproteobacteria bacterium]|jgi:hypothetical protein